MKGKIRFHLDEHVNPAIARELRRRGIDVITTVEAKLRTKSDQSQLAFATQEGRVLVTHDEDFLRFANIGKNHSGIAYCHQETRRLGEIIRMLILIYEVYTPEEIAGRIEFL